MPYALEFLRELSAFPKAPLRISLTSFDFSGPSYFSERRARIASKHWHAGAQWSRLTLQGVRSYVHSACKAPHPIQTDARWRGRAFAPRIRLREHFRL